MRFANLPLTFFSCHFPDSLKFGYINILLQWMKNQYLGGLFLLFFKIYRHYNNGNDDENDCYDMVCSNQVLVHCLSIA